MEQLEWKLVISEKANPEAMWKCSKCNKKVIVHPNYTRAGIKPCIGLNRCYDAEDVIKQMLEFRGYKFLKLEDSKNLNTTVVYYICNKGHETDLKYTSLRKGSSCKVCDVKHFKEKKSIDKAEISKKECSCKRGACEHYNHEICCPDSAKEWAYDLNHGKSPKDFAPRSSQKFWWKCSNEWCKMTYEQPMINRSKNGTRCPYCSGNKVCFWNCLATTHSEIAKDWDYENNKEDTPETVTHGSKKLVWWICNNHDPIFRYQKSIVHKISRHRNCPKCNDKGYEQRAGRNNYFLQEARKIHGNKYDYVEEYKGINAKIQIYCPVINEQGEVHGIFLQTPAMHKHGRGCPKCDIRYNQMVGGHEQFIEDARKIHGNKYQYIEEYKKADIKIKIYCPVIDKSGEAHGIFIRTPAMHKKGSGCPICSNQTKKSNLASIIHDFISDYGYCKEINWIEEYKHDLLKYISFLRIDNMLLDIKLAIEIDGAQHFRPCKFDHMQENSTTRMARDIYKDKFCLENGFSLIRIPYRHKSPTNYLAYAINLCRQGIRIYFTYQHYFDQIIKYVNIDWTKIYVLIIPCPKVTIK